MSTTLTMSYSVGTDLYVIHAGDSRAYLFRDGELAQLTSDHTLAQALVDGGRLAPEDARRHRSRNVATNVPGGPNPCVHAEIHRLSLRDGDLLLLCFDGLSTPVADGRIAEILDRHRDDVDAASQWLIQMALDSGGPDNITVIVARYRITP